MRILEELEIKMKHDKIKFISDFGSYENGFLGSLYDDGNFNKDKFHDYCKAIYDLSKIEIQDSERLKIAVKIWEVSFLIERFIGRHYNQYDFFEMRNVSDDDIEQISEIIYYTANWFSYNKPIEERLTKIGGWNH